MDLKDADKWISRKLPSGFKGSCQKVLIKLANGFKGSCQMDLKKVAKWI